MSPVPGPPFSLSEEVGAALASGTPVVALESTIVAHGLPRPDNLATARAMEKAVRREGAVPATIAVLDGQVRIGLDDRGMERIAEEDLLKASSRDIPIAVARRASAATTVAGTLWVAHRAGIRIMATGGIGGVHRDYSQSGDASADLLEISRTPVAVVCSGMKSILDLPRTLEFLETKAVPIIGYRTAELPAFYARRSGIALEHSVESARELASMIETARRLGWPSGFLVVNPVCEEDALDEAELEAMIQTALEEARSEGVFGKQVTPFLLSSIQTKSQGRALKANKSLAVSNAALAARISRELHE